MCQILDCIDCITNCITNCCPRHWLTGEPAPRSTRTPPVYRSKGDDQQQALLAQPEGPVHGPSLVSSNVPPEMDREMAQTTTLTHQQLLDELESETALQVPFP